MQSSQTGKAARSGFIYFIGYVGDETAPIKIGRAHNVQERLQGLQTANPAKLAIRRTILVANMKEAEAKAHARFQKDRIDGGEWFNISMDAIREYAEN